MPIVSGMGDSGLPTGVDGIRFPRTAIYGAGNIGRDVCEVLTRHGWPVACFFDIKARPGDRHDGIPILHPDDETLTFEQRAGMTLIIGIFNRDVDLSPLVQELSAAGFGQVMTFLDFHALFARELGDRFWLTSRSYYRHARTQIEEASGLWADDASRDLYRQTLTFRLTGEDKGLPPPDLQHQYFPTDIPEWKMPLRFVDCGAYDGDTLAALTTAGKAFEAIAAFEPDQDNFQKLALRIRSGPFQNACLWPCGVHSSTAALLFDDGMASGSALSEAGSATIQCVALDDAIPHFKPTLIKMDIEGAEIDALVGAQSIISQCRPGLAICVYHRPAHLWQIPLLIRQWRCGYKFYLRSHRFNGFETVMYAIAD